MYYFMIEILLLFAMIDFISLNDGETATRSSAADCYIPIAQAIERHLRLLHDTKLLSNILYIFMSADGKHERRPIQSVMS